MSVYVPNFRIFHNLVLIFTNCNFLEISLDVLNTIMLSYLHFEAHFNEMYERCLLWKKN